jgi:hypothetical protein
MSMDSFFVEALNVVGQMGISLGVKRLEGLAISLC